MRILHYMFGIPPVREGGMVRYASGLMLQQARMGEEVYLLLPGTLPADTGKKTKIYCEKAGYLGVPVYRAYNPLPVAVCNGILDTAAYMAGCRGNAYRAFLRRIQPDVIHVHTFMGLHREFLEEARRFGIPVVFTSHDYFGICPTAVMVSGGRICRDVEWRTCAQCCQHAFSGWRLRIEQAPWYGWLRKKERLVRPAKIAFHGAAGLWGRLSKGLGVQDQRMQAQANPGYAVLRAYYRSMFGMVSCFHFNSTLAAGIYRSRLGHLQEGREVILPVSHQGISDCRRIRSFGKTLRVGYIGSWSRHKGFFALLHACSFLVQSGCTDLELHLYSSTARRAEPFVRNHPAFVPEDLGAVMDGIDLLALPSRWPETFGLAALEAASYGVPVLLPKYAGACDIFRESQDAGFIYDGTVQGLKEMLRRIYEDRSLLVQANRSILKMGYDFSFAHHAERMAHIYNCIRNEKAGRQKTDRETRK